MVVKATAKRVLRIALGVVVVLLGIIQLFTPGQGLLFILVGLMIMARDVPPLQRLGKRIEARYPRQVAVIRRGEKWLMGKLRRTFRWGARSRKSAAPNPASDEEKNERRSS